MSGINHSPLQHTTPSHYIESPWVKSVQSFLHTCNASIYIPSLGTTKLFRTNDRLIMDIASSLSLPTHELQNINRCRIYLQVMNLSEISNSNGTHLLQSAFHGTPQPDGTPLLNATSASTLDWPPQLRPDKTSWASWQRLLRTLTTNDTSFQLQQSLREWLHPLLYHRIWQFQYDPTCNEIITTNLAGTHQYTLHDTKTRQAHAYR
jgi:hypothetical protein